MQVFITYMTKILEYLKLVVFVTGVLVGIQVPGFIDQYGKNLSARVAESNQSLSQFQDDADKYFAGDLDKLIDYYSQKSDPVIVSGGESIESILSRNRYLTQALDAFNQSPAAAYIHVFMSPVIEIRQAVWENFSYGVMLDGTAIGVGILAGLIALIGLDLMLNLLRILAGLFNRAPKRLP